MLALRDPLLSIARRQLCAKPWCRHCVCAGWQGDTASQEHHPVRDRLPVPHESLISPSCVVQLRMGLYDVVKTEWFEQCLVGTVGCSLWGVDWGLWTEGCRACLPSLLQKEGRSIPLVPSHMVYTSPQTAESFSQLFDCHGDSYREPVTEESLRAVFGVITEMASACEMATAQLASL